MLTNLCGVRLINTLSDTFVGSYRDRTPPWGPIGYITYKRTYSRLIPELDRSEEWYETCERVCNALLSSSNLFSMEEMEQFYDILYNFKGMVSGRALWQLGTKTVDKIGADSLQGCWFVKINNIEAFCFLFNQLMLGGGVGFNVQSKYVFELPIIKNNVEIKRVDTADCDFVVPDNREGWIELLRRILQAFYVTGKDLYYSTQLLRAAGKPLKSFGGVALGSEYLVENLNQIVKIFKSRHLTKLRPIDCVDICNIIAQIVIAGNVRRSAELAIGDIQDELFLKAKNWKECNIPNWRSLSNNVVSCNEFKLLNTTFWDGFEGYGEPYGLINLRNCRTYGRLIDGLGYRVEPDIVGVNACGELPLCDKEPCNLADIYLPNLKDVNEFKTVAILLYKACKTIANLPFNDPETQAIVTRNQKMGIGLTGYMGCKWAQDASVLDQVYRALEEADTKYSQENGWNRSIKLTTVKPSGTLSLLAGVTSGIHAAFSPYMIRRIRFSSNDPLVKLCRKSGYSVEPQILLDGQRNLNMMIVDFPIKTPANTTIEEDLSIIEKLEIHKFVQTHWSDNSISITHYYRPEELDTIKKWLSENYDQNVKTISFFPVTDHGFVQAPLEKITKEKFLEMTAAIKPLANIRNASSDAIELTDCEGGCPVR